MSDSESLPPVQSVPLPNQPPPQLVTRPPDDGFTVRMPRVQEVTLGAVVTAAISFGIWMGTLNTKLDHIEKFVDSANDGSTGVFVRLATIQTTLNVSESARPSVPTPATNNERVPPIEVRLDPANQLSMLDRAAEIKLIEDILKFGNSASSPGPSSANNPQGAPPPNPSGGSGSEDGQSPDAGKNAAMVARARAEIEAMSEGQLKQLEDTIRSQKRLPPDQKDYVLRVIDSYITFEHELSPQAASTDTNQQSKSNSSGNGSGKKK